jgi:hypothetical protein
MKFDYSFSLRIVTTLQSVKVLRRFKGTAIKDLFCSRRKSLTQAIHYGQGTTRLAVVYVCVCVV